MKFITDNKKITLKVHPITFHTFEKLKSKYIYKGSTTLLNMPKITYKKNSWNHRSVANKNAYLNIFIPLLFFYLIVHYLKNFVYARQFAINS